jgi:DNA-binding transcriptional ArsR family regulator
MVNMPRTKNASPHSYQKIYARLLRGPLWLADYASTGLARSTLYERLQFLVTKGLVRIEKQGKRKYYYISQPPNENRRLTIDDMKWYRIMYTPTRKEKRRIKKELHTTLRRLATARNNLERNILIMGEINQKIEEFIASEESQEVLEAINQTDIDWRAIPIPNLVFGLILPYLDGTLCIDCLREGFVVWLITPDHKTGEVICPRTGFVKRVDVIKTEIVTNFRPFRWIYIFRL